MAQHDFRYNLLNPEYSLNECRNLAPGRYQVSGQGGAIQVGDSLLVSLKGSHSLSMTLEVEKVRHLLNPPGAWIATAKGPVFGELRIHQQNLQCSQCETKLDIEFAVDAKQSKGLQQAAIARITELGWLPIGKRHLCPDCQHEETP